jgi:mannobiose 2-epimerase
MQAGRIAGVPAETHVGLYRMLWDNALEHGFDHRRGGLYENGPPGRPADKLNKIWWVQAEALPSALELWRRTQDERYRRAFELTLDWITNEQADWNAGDWHAAIQPNGRPAGGKSGDWKDPYHQGRAVLECLDAPERA